MSLSRNKWMVTLLVALAVLVLPLIWFLPRGSAPVDDPWSAIAPRLPKTEHAALMTGPYESGPAVTRACLECHEDAADEVMLTSHWTWETEPLRLPNKDGLHRLGKKHVINNFCIGVQSNWPSCTSCHAGYGWSDDSFDFSASEQVDCLVCHDHSGGYAKSRAGLPAEGVDLVLAAQSVGGATRETCGGCHFKGGGGDAIKHGDLDTSLQNPPERVDVHMGRHQMICTDCHRTENHNIQGRSITVSFGQENRVACTDCHAPQPHGDERLDLHTQSVACQTCHIPEVALRKETKVHWDWSEAGQDLEEDPHVYLKKKGRFEMTSELNPEYAWFNGASERYVLGDTINEEGPTSLNRPLGSFEDPDAQIWPFKIHRGKQIFDANLRHLLVPNTVGPEGYWTTFDWNSALERGSAAADLEYSGSYDFTETEMHWPLTHMVGPKSQALQCADCHGENSILDWTALGFAGDPIEWGSRPASRPPEMTKVQK